MGLRPVYGHSVGEETGPLVVRPKSFHERAADGQNDVGTLGELSLLDVVEVVETMVHGPLGAEGAEVTNDAGVIRDPEERMSHAVCGAGLVDGLGVESVAGPTENGESAQRER
jgi:hypothetical protein